MRRASAVFIAVVCIVAPFQNGPVDARQGSASQASEEARRRAEEQAEQEMQAVEKAEAEWRAETEKAFQETRQQRADFDKKMDDFADAHSKDAGTRVTYVMTVGDDGLPTGGEVWFVNRGFITHRAEFDANGNTKGLFITPDGRARQSITAHRTPGVPASGRYLFTTGLDGRTQISDVVWQADDGTRGHMKFNLDGNAYLGEFWGPDGQRSGGFYDASLEPKEELPPPLWVPPVPRISTQPCEPCRGASDAYNEIAHKMLPIQHEMAEQARAIATTSPGRARSAIVDRYNVLKAQWDAGAPQLEAALAALRACIKEKCSPKTSENRGAVTTAQVQIPGATDPSQAIVVRDGVSKRDHVALVDGGRIFVGVNNGSGIGNSMFAFRPFPFDGQVTDLLAGDFNGDSRDDLVYLNAQANFIAVALNDGNNFFASPIRTETGVFTPVGARIADVNDDDRLDLVVLNRGTGNIESQSVVMWLLGDGTGRLQVKGQPLKMPNFGLSLVGGTADFSPSTIPRIVDFNDDGFADFAVASTAGGVSNATGAVPTVTLLLNRPDAPGNFTLSQPFEFPQFRGSVRTAAADMNADGRTDLVVGGPSGVQILQGISGGLTRLPVIQLSAGIANATAAGANYQMAVTDYNADGSPDVVVNNSALFINRTASPGALPVFQFAPEFQGGRVLRTGDFNQDGAPDLIRMQGNALNVSLGSSALTVTQNRTSTTAEGISMSGDPVDQIFFRWAYTTGGPGTLSPGDPVDRVVNADGSVSYTVTKYSPQRSTIYTARPDGTVVKGGTPATATANSVAGLPDYLSQQLELRKGWSTLDDNNPSDHILLEYVNGAAYPMPATAIRRVTNADGSVDYFVETAFGTSRYTVTADGTLFTPSTYLDAAGLLWKAVFLSDLEKSTEPTDRAFLNAAKTALAQESQTTVIMRSPKADGSVEYWGAAGGTHTVIPNSGGGLSVRLPSGETVSAVGGQGGLDAAAKALVPEPATSSNACSGNSCSPSTQPEVCTGSGCSAARPTLECELPGCQPQTCSVGEMCTDLTNFSDCQGCTQIGSGDRDESVQYMIIEIVIVRAAERFRELPTIAQTARSLWETLRGFIAGAPSVNAARSMGLEHARPAFNQSGRQGGVSQFGATTLLTSLGTSMGEAFQIQVANDGKTPINLNGNGVIVEPLKQAAGQQARRAMSQLASRNPITQKLDAYCVEMLKQTPSLGTIFRVASPEIQKRFAPMRRVLQASYRLQQAGALKPDSDPKAYFTSIKQWALWSRERNFNEKSYGDAFVEHTKKSATEQGVKWTSQIEAGIRALVPNRWADISKILQAVR